MKKIIIIFMFLLIGCSSNAVSNKDLYTTYRKNLINQTEFAEELPFKINVYFDSISDEEIRYQVVIDENEINMHNVKALVVHDHQTTDIFPSIGIFDEPVDLIVGSDDVKGIKLVGYIDTLSSVEELKIETRVYLNYKDESGEVKDIYYRSTK